MTRLEVEVAELLVDCIPVTEQARFARNGADVCNAAVKLARYVTGKQHVIFCGYHGGNDSYLATTDKHGGLLPQISPFNHQVTWNDDDRLLDVLDGCYKDLAAIIFEVPPEPQNRSTSDTMRTMQRFIELAHSNGALAIIDEVVTGFRYSLGGAQAYYGVQADVSCFSKALANGYPLAALCGPRDLMQSFDGGSVFLSTTFGGEATALAAAKATITTLQQPGTLARLREHGTTVLDALRDALTARRLPVRVRGNYARFVLDWQDVPDCASAAELRTLWLQELAKHGILASVPWFPMVAWDGTVTAQLITGIDRACTTIQAVVRGTCAIGDALECPTITDVFQQRYAPAQEPSP
jgi:glutamate-1-semialdehyde aminotransferase